jgi:hypothetical protein
VPRIHVVTPENLARARRRVIGELQRHGFWDEDLAAVAVELTWLGSAYGWQYYGSSGEIRIPRISVARLQDRWNQSSYVSLADVLRHEYGHALADTHRGLFRSRRFSGAFGAPHDGEGEGTYDPLHFVSEWAATNAAEDYAETFALYLRHDGRLPSRLDTPAIREKWRFVRDLGKCMRAGRRTWAARSA